MTPQDLYNDPTKIAWQEPIVIDFETYYDKDYSLRKVTTEKYIRCEQFECIGVSVKHGARPTDFFPRETGIDYIRRLVTANPASPVVSHNTNFDLGILAFHHDVHPNFTVDTCIMAKLCGLDRVAGGVSLAKITGFLATRGVLPTVKGTEVHNMAGVHADDMTYEQWQAYGDYCTLDVDLTYGSYVHMLDKVPTSELIMADITTKMWTQPAIDLDTELLEEYAARLENDKAEMLDRIRQDLGFADNNALLAALRSSAKFCAVLRSLGVEPPTKWSEKQYKFIPAVSKTDLEFLELLEHENPLVRLLVETKLGSMSSMEQTRTATFLDIAQRGLMPIPLRYAAAHTGRYGGSDKLNIQNLPSRTKEPVLRRSLRPIAGHVWVAADSSQIEARVLSMMAGQQDLVDTFVSGRDVYIEMATKIYGKTYDEIYEISKRNPTKEGKAMRNLGKSCILGMGYSMSAQKFSDTNKQQGTDIPLHQAQDLVSVYRKSYAMIPAFWRKCNDVLDVMYSGGKMWFGGADNNLFFADGTSEFFGVRIPSIRMPNGQYIFYQNLRKEVKDTGQISYVYDQFKHGKWLPKYVFGGSLTENLCIAEDTLVLTDSGWKKIQDITTKDKVHDGIEFVTHGGLVFKSAKDCVKIDGVYMTKDHEVLTDDGWKTAEVHLSAGATSQISRFDFSEVWQADCYQGDPFGRKEVALGLPMRVWECCEQASGRCEKGRKKGRNAPLWLQYIRSCFKQTKFTRLHTAPNLLDMAEYESPLSKSKPQGLEKLWWQGYNSVRTMVRLSDVLIGYVTKLSARVGLRPQRQQSWILQGELSLGYTTDKLQQQTQQCTHTGWQRATDGSGVLRALQSQRHNGTLSVITGSNNAETGEAADPKKAVYDILNCGSRNRFVVKGDTAPFVVHNCQALAFVILKWQAIEIAKHGISVNLNVHDEWASVVPREQAAQVAKIYYDCMKATPSYIPDGLLDCEVDVGINYADLHTIDVAKALGDKK